ncbi:hypothetical protein oki361_07910 [Helicobacter pylori]
MVLWSENLKIDSLEILKDPKIKRIAMANPKLAPYGKASMEVLDHLKFTSSLKSKIVMALLFLKPINLSLLKTLK